MAAKESKALVPEVVSRSGLPAPVDLADFAIMAVAPTDMREIVGENMGESQITPFDLDRIKVGAAGSTFWQVDGAEEPVKEITGVIVHFRDVRSYWSKNLDAGSGSAPPDCSSKDAMHGEGIFGPGSEGNPTGLCVKCPMSRFNTARNNGRGQACRLGRDLFMMQPHSIIPAVVALPPSSVKAARKYFVNGLIARALKYWEVMSTIALEKTRSTGGIDYALAKFKIPIPLSPATVERFKLMRQAFMPIFEVTKVVMDTDEKENE